jgi:hypothetical protein
MQVVKLGGSLIRYAKDILAILRGYDVLIVPGGGVFANTVRRVYEELSLTDLAAHKMAILAMDQYGLLLSDLSGLPTSESPDAATPFIFLPSSFLEEKDPFQPSWDVTSDTIACYIAKEVGADGLLILTDVDGIFLGGELVGEVSAKELQYTETCVDKALPRYLMEYRMDCWVVNGRDLERVRDAMEGNIMGTLILGR